MRFTFTGTGGGNLIPIQLSSDIEHIPYVLKGIAAIRWTRTVTRNSAWSILAESLFTGRKEKDSVKSKILTLVSENPSKYLCDVPYPDGMHPAGDPVIVKGPDSSISSLPSKHSSTSPSCPMCSPSSSTPQQKPPSKLGHIITKFTNLFRKKKESDTASFSVQNKSNSFEMTLLCEGCTCICIEQSVDKVQTEDHQSNQCPSVLKQKTCCESDEQRSSVEKLETITVDIHKESPSEDTDRENSTDINTNIKTISNAIQETRQLHVKQHGDTNNRDSGDYVCVSENSERVSLTGSSSYTTTNTSIPPIKNSEKLRENDEDVNHKPQTSPHCREVSQMHSSPPRDASLTNKTKDKQEHVCKVKEVLRPSECIVPCPVEPPLVNDSVINQKTLEEACANNASESQNQQTKTCDKNYNVAKRPVDISTNSVTLVDENHVPSEGSDNSKLDRKEVFV